MHRNMEAIGLSSQLQRLVAAIAALTSNSIVSRRCLQQRCLPPQQPLGTDLEMKMAGESREQHTCGRAAKE